MAPILRLASHYRRRAVIVLIFFTFAVGVVTLRRQDFDGPTGMQFDEGRVVIYEEGTHDEVIGAMAVSLASVGVRPTFDCFFRHQFQPVLRTLLGYEPTIETPHGQDRAIDRRIAEDSIDFIILTTCSWSLKRMHAEILDSSAHVICIVHHAGRSLYEDVKPLIDPFARQNRITLVVLGDHVKRSVISDVQDWAEQEMAVHWATLPVETLIPIFDYPALIRRPEPAVWPSRAVVQGNIVPGRRNYQKLFKDLRHSMLDNPALWGYSSRGLGLPLTPQPAQSPFTLHLVGQTYPGYPVDIPTELDNVVSVHESLPFHDYYTFISECDIMVPAFSQRSTYQETTSSSIAAAVITRIPILVSDRHTDAYTYISGPAEVHKNISTNDAQALESLRRRGQQPRASGKEWERYLAPIMMDNARMWNRVLSVHS